MKIINRYVLREHAGPLVFAVASLTSLLLLNYIAKQIGQLVGKGLPWTVIVEFISLSIPLTFALTAPMAVLVAVLYAFSRLAAENEITALKATGVSVGRVLVPVVIASFFLTLIMVAFNDQALSRANHCLRTLQSDIARKKPTFALRPRVINEVSPGKLFLNATHIDPATNQLREITIYDLGDPTRDRTIYADSGLMALSPATGELELTLFHGSMNEVQKTTPSELQRMFYLVDVIRVKGVGDQLTRSTNDDYKSDREMTVCELQVDVAAGEQTKMQAVSEVRNLLVDAVRTATTGVYVPRRPPQQTPAPAWGLGRAYCEGLAGVGNFVGKVRGKISGKLRGGDSATTPPPKPAVLAASAAPPAPAPAPAPAPPPVFKPATPPLRHAVKPAVKPILVRPPHQVAQRPPIRLPKAPLPPTPVYRPPFIQSPASIMLTTLTSSIEATRARVDEGKRTRNLYDNQIHKLFAISVACMTFVILGAPIALRFPRGGVGMVLGVSLGVFALYYVGLIAGEPLAQRGDVAPWVAMWASNIVLGAIGLFLLTRIGRESSTSRGSDWTEFRDRMGRRLAKLVPGHRRRAALSAESV